MKSLDGKNLRNLYPQMHKEEAVSQAAERTKLRTGERVSQKPALMLQNYLNRVLAILDRENPKDIARGIRAFTKVLLEKS